MTHLQHKEKKIGSLLLALLALAAGTLPFLLFREQIQRLAAVGYAGLFLGCFATNASVLLPASGIAYTLAAATVLDPLLCALTGGLGTACGELVGYCVGRWSRVRIDGSPRFAKIAGSLERYGYLAVFTLAFLPLPLFDIIGIAAGTARLSPGRFFLVCCAGKIGKMLVYVFVLRQYIPL